MNRLFVLKYVIYFSLMLLVSCRGTMGTIWK